MSDPIGVVLLVCAGYGVWRLAVKPMLQPGISRHHSYADDAEIESDPDTYEALPEEIDGGPYFPSKSKIHIKYLDASKRITERPLVVREFQDHKAGYLNAYCELRNAYRTFRIDRIKWAATPETGEVIDDLRGWLKDEYAKTPDATLSSLIGGQEDSLRALLFVGKADGRLTAKERKVILEHMHQITLDPRLDDEHVKACLNSVSLPSIAAYRLICGRLSKSLDAEQKQALLKTVLGMINTEKTIGQEEADAYAYMKKRFAE